MAPNVLSLFQQNLRHCTAASNQLKVLYSPQPDILLIQEPYLAPEIGFLPVYSHSCRILCSPDVRKPKLSTIITNPSLIVSIVPEFSNHFCLSVSILTTNRPIYLSNCYIRPNTYSDEHSIFFNSLLSRFSVCDFVLCGDFNARNMAWGDRLTSRQGRLFADDLSLFNLSLCNTRGFTCFINNGRAVGQSVVDLTFVSPSLHSSISGWRLEQEITFSDHASILFSLRVRDCLLSSTRHSTWKFSENRADWARFSTLINSSVPELTSLYHTIELCVTCPQIDTAISHLSDIILNAAYASLPRKRIRAPSNDKTFWSTELANEHTHFKQIRNLYFRRRVDADFYNNARNRYRRLCRAARRKAWNDFISDFHNDSPFGSAYKVLKKKIKTTPDGIPFLDGLSPDALSTKTDLLIDTLFPQSTDLSTPPLCSLPPSYSPASITEIDFLIKTSNCKKAPGPDHITNRMLRAASPAILPSLTSIINKCLCLGYFPAIWTAGSAVIIPKPGKSDYHSAKSYRPIVLTPCLSKVLEKVIKARLEDHLSTHSPLHANQYAFRRGLSTTNALSHITRSIINLKQQKRRIALLAVDIAGAFDNASWSKIMEALSRSNTPIYIRNCIRGYLYGRKVSFSYNNYSITRTLSKGTPQGGVLSPLLWNILLDSLFHIRLQNTEIVAYADDITAICWADKNDEASLIPTASHSLSAIQNWCNDHHLSIAPNKTSLVYFHCLQKLPLRFGDITITPEPHLRILGLTFGDSRCLSKLQCHFHITDVISRCNKVKNVLFGIAGNTYGMDSRKRIILYKAVIRSKIMYAHEIWSKHCTAADIKALNSLQHSFLRHAICGFRTISQDAARFLSGTLSIPDYISWRSLPFNQRSAARTDFLEKYRLGSGENLRLFCPSSPLPKFFLPTFSLVQFVTGHGRFGAYFLRFGCKTTDACDCDPSGLTSQTPIHVLLHCPLFADIRPDEFRLILDPSSLCFDKDSLKILKSFCSSACGKLNVIHG